MVKTQRCTWCGTDTLYTRYHDEEWGVPLRDADALFELLVMEGMQAGLSWITILRKRKRFRELMFNLVPSELVKTDVSFIDRLLLDSSIIRHRGKLEACVHNARNYLQMADRQDIVDYLWAFTGGSPRINNWSNAGEVPAYTKESELMSRTLKKAGFKFVGPTICYAFMQSAGMVNDHLAECYRHAACQSDDVKRALVIEA